MFVLLVGWWWKIIAGMHTKHPSFEPFSCSGGYETSFSSCYSMYWQLPFYLQSRFTSHDWAQVRCDHADGDPLLSAEVREVTEPRSEMQHHQRCSWRSSRCRCRGRSRRRAGRPAACRGYCRPASRLPAGRPSAVEGRGHAACGRTSTAPSRRPDSRSCCSRWACSRSRAGWCRPPAGPRPGRGRGRGRTGGDASAAPPPPASCGAESANRHCIASVDNVMLVVRGFQANNNLLIGRIWV